MGHFPLLFVSSPEGINFQSPWLDVYHDAMAPSQVSTPVQAVSARTGDAVSAVLGEDTPLKGGPNFPLES